MDVPKTKKTGFESYFHEEQEKRKAREDALAQAFMNNGYWVDTTEALGGLLDIAEEFDIKFDDLARVWRRFPNGCTIRSSPPPISQFHECVYKYTISQSVHKFDEFREFLRKLRLEHKERQAQADLHTSRIKPYQYGAGFVNQSDLVLPPGRHFDGFYSEYGQAFTHAPDSWKQVQGRAVIDKLFDLVEHAEKAEAGREKAQLGRERLLEELCGLRLELGQLTRPSRSDTERTFYVACACLGALVLMLIFK